MHMVVRLYFLQPNIIYKMPKKAPPYPILANADEEQLLDNYIDKIYRVNLKVAKDFWVYTRTMISLQTQTPDHFKWSKSDYVFKPLEPHILKAVLLVAMRFNWPPEEILALWQIEGLVTYTAVLKYYGYPRVSLEKKGIAKDTQTILNREPGFQLPSRKALHKRYVHTFARSFVLFNRWGLDILTPHKQGYGDNYLITTSSSATHDEAFLTGKHQPKYGPGQRDRAEPGGFENQIKDIIVHSPLDYLKDMKNGPIIVEKNRNGNWYYSTKSEYQTTMLALQYGRFKHLESIIPTRLITRDFQISLKPPFPAFVRTFYNCPSNRLRKRLIDELIYLVQSSLKSPAASGIKKQYGKGYVFKSEQMQSLFIHNTPSKQILQQIANGKAPGACYLGGLRFEVLRQTYKILFNDTI